ncbi:shikimate dehydrogenase [Weissella hellenica]|uniref:shikimate dehydrogenase n=1 Tax=Weissella hellenica TaxID=46256 RepID=UPI0038870226
MTDYYGLIGYPVEHSKSPIMQNQAFRLANIDATYQLFPIEPQNLATTLPQLVAQGIKGLNVTMPFKQAVVPYMDEISDLSKRLGVVNTITIKEGRLFGDTTDGQGFWTTITQAPKQTIIIGTGGAAQAIIASAPRTTQVHVFNRMSEKFAAKAEALADLMPEPLHDLATITQYLPTADLIVNATSVGMKDEPSLLSPHQFSLTPRQAQVVDIIYKTDDTPFVSAAKQAHREAMDGLAMLAGQGALSFATWTGIIPDQQRMLVAISEERRN